MRAANRDFRTAARRAFFRTTRTNALEFLEPFIFLT
jgi:hypothetical protein